MFDTPAELHSALNDLPAALLFISVLLDWSGTATRRESLKAAGFWTLLAGAVGALLAVWSGLSAEGWVDHGANSHRFIARHETLAIITTIFYGALAAWRGFRRGTFSGKERPIYLGAATFGLLLLFWVGHIGGMMVFRQGVGVPATVMEEALRDRARGHEHAPGEEHEHSPGSEHEPASGDETEHDEGVADQ